LHDAGFDIVGVDGMHECVRRASQRYPGIRFVEASAYDDINALCGGPFDAIVSVEVIEHLFSPSTFARRCCDALCPHGLLIVTTPYWGYLKNLLMALTNRTDRALTALWEGGHIKHWSYATLRQLLETHGFEYVAFHGAGRPIPYCWNGMIMVARK